MWEVMNCEEPFILIKPLDAAIGVATGDLRLPSDCPDDQINNAMRMCWRDVSDDVIVQRFWSKNRTR